MGQDNAILPEEKLNNTIDCPIIPFSTVMDYIFTSLEPAASGRCFSPLKNMVMVLYDTDDFKNGFD